MFQSVDLRQNFYYSYSYDLTHTLQYNLTKVHVDTDLNLNEGEKYIGIANKPCEKFLWNDFLLQNIRNRVNSHWILNLVHGYLGQSSKK